MAGTLYALIVRTAEEWKATLRARLREALGAREKPVVAVLRETLAAIENAEAPPVASAPASKDALFAGSVGGLGAGEVERLVLDHEAVVAIIRREVRERREASAEYVRLGRHEEASVLASQVAVLVALGVERS